MHWCIHLLPPIWEGTVQSILVAVKDHLVEHFLQGLTFVSQAIFPWYGQVEQGDYPLSPF